MGPKVTTLNRAVDLQVKANQHIEIYLTNNGGKANSATCTASGTLDTLQ